MRFLTAMIALSVFVSPVVAKDNIDVNDLVKQHLNSIGSEQARAAVKTRVAEGTLKFRLVSGGTVDQDGKQVFISEGSQLVTLLKLPTPNYHGERFVSNGKNTAIATMAPGTYSEFGQFVRTHDEILTEGLWGGTLSTGWALARLEKDHAKLKYQGLKKVNGRELHEVRYLPGKSDLEILLYFEPESFRHVLTVYSLTISAQIARTDIETASQQATHYRLEERFSDFKSTDNLTLPGHWTIEFMPDVPEQRSIGHPLIIAASRNKVSQFDVTETTISHNVTLDPRNFEIK